MKSHVLPVKLAEKLPDCEPISFRIRSLTFDLDALLSAARRIKELGAGEIVGVSVLFHASFSMRTAVLSCISVDLLAFLC